MNLRPFLLFFLFAPLVVSPVTASQGADGGMFWWNDRVFYEIFVRSFNDSDGDGVGDLQGVIDKLDYLNDGDPTTTADLGVTGIWLMPITQSASYHGYDVTDYRTIEADYGTNGDFMRLVDEAHQRGIAVIMDMVINHTSREHPWFVQSNRRDETYNDWYVWADTHPEFTGPDGQIVWHPLGGRYYYGVFWDGMPDLNLNNPAVTDELYRIARFWLDGMGVDGFRLDAIKHLIEEGNEQENTPSTLAWMASFNDFIDTVNPDALTVGEVWESDFISSQYVPDQADMVFDFDVATALITTVRQNRPDAMNSIIARVADLYPQGQYATFLTNHDQNRVMEELRGNVDEAKVAASLLLTTPGVPFTYYGEEIGMTGRKPDERIRTPMRWDETPYTAGFTSAPFPYEALSADDAAVSVASQTDDPDSLLSHYRSLIQLRAAHPALARGSYLPVSIEGTRNAYAFIRHTADETILVLINLNDEETADYSLTLENTDFNVTGGTLLFGQGEFSAPTDGLSGYTPFERMPPYSTYIMQLSVG
jgi:glycosidase